MTGDADADSVGFLFRGGIGTCDAFCDGTVGVPGAELAGVELGRLFDNFPPFFRDDTTGERGPAEDCFLAASTGVGAGVGVGDC